MRRQSTGGDSGSELQSSSQFVIISKYLQILRRNTDGGHWEIIKFFYQSPDLLVTSPGPVIAHESHHKHVNRSECLS